MPRRFTSSLIFLLLAGVPVFGQIGIPGTGYPRGGGYPGQQRYPQGGQGGPSQDRQSSSSTLTGILRKIADKSVVIEDDNKTITTVSIAGSTKYTGTSGSSAKIGDFQPGDHISISANQDNKKAYKAVSMRLEKEGTPEEHSIASAATEDTSHPLDRPSDSSSGSSSAKSAPSSASNAPSPSSGGSGSRPTLSRAASGSDGSVPSASGSSSGSSSSASSGDSDSNHPSLRRTPSGSTASSSSSSGSSSDDYDPNRPVLHRAPGSSSDSATSSSSASSPAAASPGDNDPDRPRLRRATSGSDNTASSASNNSSASSPVDSDDDRPRIRRAVSDADSTPRAQIAPDNSAPAVTPAPRDSASSAPPQLRRAAPASAPDPVVADARPSLHAEDVNGATRAPSPPQLGAPAEATSSGSPRISQRGSSTGDPFIDQTRDAAFSFSETLPNYVVKQFTTRYATVPTRGGKASWQALDVVTADVIEEDGNEKYKNILVNGKPPREDVEKSGSWSRGEFSSLLQDILSPITNADFHGKRATTIVNRAAFRYDFSVEQPNSHWHVQSEGQSYMPAYSGAVWIDKENYRVLRIELQAQNMPRGFPLDQVESAVDYDYVFIGDSKYLLPTHSEALSCARAGNDCTRNVIEFRNYKKFSADTSITFDPN